MEQDVLDYIDQIKRDTDYFGKSKLVNFLVHQKHIKIKDLAPALGLKPSYLCHIMRLAKLSEIVMDGYYSKLISMSHLFVISLLHSETDIMDIYEEVLSRGLTVLQTEDLVRKRLHGISPGGTYFGEEKLNKQKNILKKKFNADTKVVQTRIKTKLIIEWQGSRQERRQDVERFFRMIESQEEKDSQ